MSETIIYCIIICPSSRPLSEGIFFVTVIKDNQVLDILEQSDYDDDDAQIDPFASDGDGDMEYAPDGNDGSSSDSESTTNDEAEPSSSSPIPQITYASLSSSMFQNRTWEDAAVN